MDSFSTLLVMVSSTVRMLIFTMRRVPAITLIHCGVPVSTDNTDPAECLSVYMSFIIWRVPYR